jgi:hypothetical protein
MLNDGFFIASELFPYFLFRLTQILHSLKNYYSKVFVNMNVDINHVKISNAPQTVILNYNIINIYFSPHEIFT